ncbi:MAG: diphthine synthase [Nanoarchaeota archaeon]
MLYLVGLGLSNDSISKKGLDAVKECERVYLESYTVEFPYDVKELEKTIGKKPVIADREFVEEMKFLDEAKKTDVALLIYGSPLAATTHISIMQEAKRKKIATEIIENASVFDAVAETGLQVYKFGKTASMPGFSADSYTSIIKENKGIKAHTLILIDIGLSFQDALKKLEGDCNKNGVKMDKIIICERLGLPNSHIYHDTPNRLRYLKIKAPFCIIIPSELHFIEKEFLEKI